MSPSILRDRLVLWVSMRRWEVLVFALALGIRLLLISVAPQHHIDNYWLGFDGEDYVNEAQNILDGNGFSRVTEPPFVPDTLKTPLYPLVLAGIYLLTGSFASILILQAVLSSLIPIVVMRTAQFVVKSRRIILGIGLFFVFEPHLIFCTTFFGTEGIAVVLVAWGIYEVMALLYADRPHVHGLRAALAFGLATLARPITYYLPLLLVPFLTLYGYSQGRLSETMRAIGIFVAVFTIVISPWVVRNYVVFGVADMSTASWFNIYTRLAATVQSIDTGDDFYTSFQKLLNELSLRGYIQHPPPVHEMEIQDPRFSPILQQESLRVIREHPSAFIKYLATVPVSVLTQSNLLGYTTSFVPFEYDRPKFSPTLYASQYGIVALIDEVAPYLIGPYAAPYLVRVFYMVVFILACVGTLILWLRNERFAALFLFGLIVYLVALTAVAGAQIGDRHRAPLLPAEIILAAVAIEWMRAKRV